MPGALSLDIPGPSIAEARKALAKVKATAKERREPLLERRRSKAGAFLRSEF
jgi:hypothetical protein